MTRTHLVCAGCSRAAYNEDSPYIPEGWGEYRVQMEQVHVKPIMTTVTAVADRTIQLCPQCDKKISPRLVHRVRTII
jgi:hypothetical protein